MVFCDFFHGEATLCQEFLDVGIIGVFVGEMLQDIPGEADRIFCFVVISEIDSALASLET